MNPKLNICKSQQLKKIYPTYYNNSIRKTFSGNQNNIYVNPNSSSASKNPSLNVISISKIINGMQEKLNHLNETIQEADNTVNLYMGKTCKNSFCDEDEEPKAYFHKVVQTLDGENINNRPFIQNKIIKKKNSINKLLMDSCNININFNDGNIKNYSKKLRKGQGINANKGSLNSESNGFKIGNNSFSDDLNTFPSKFNRESTKVSDESQNKINDKVNYNFNESNINFPETNLKHNTIQENNNKNNENNNIIFKKYDYLTFAAKKIEVPKGEINGIEEIKEMNNSVESERNDINSSWDNVEIEKHLDKENKEGERILSLEKENKRLKTQNEKLCVLLKKCRKNIEVKESVLMKYNEKIRGLEKNLGEKDGYIIKLEEDQRKMIEDNSKLMLFLKETKAKNNQNFNAEINRLKNENRILVKEINKLRNYIKNLMGKNKTN